MVCVNCEQWSYRYSWKNERLADKDPRRRHSYVDPQDPSLYWFVVCRPDSKVNAVRHASFQLEEEAAASGAWDLQAVHVAQVRSLVRAAKELRDAWTVYYAYL